MMFKLCSCNAVIKITEKSCAKCQAERTSNAERSDYHRYYDRKHRHKASQTFYQSSAWKKTRRAIMNRDNYLCTRCLQHHEFNEAHIVDHIVPLRVDWSLRLVHSNLQSLCQSCHSRKTRREQSVASHRPPR